MYRAAQPLLRKLAAVLLLALAALASTPASAQPGNPQLTARVRGVNSAEAASSALALESLDVRVRLHGTIAESTVTARFANSGREILEGDFTLAMPAGSAVTGYALDVGGAMVDGVLVDQRKARLAYEARLRAGVDPGLAEVGRDNLFHTRVFPIMPQSGRTIRLRFATPLDPEHGYVLPLGWTGKVGRFTLDIVASGAGGPPRLDLPGGLAARWESQGDRHHIAVERQDLRLAGRLALVPAEPAPILVSLHPGEDRFFQIVDSVRSGRGDAAPAAHVAILWDRSRSRTDDALDREIKLVGDYLDRVGPATIELLLFDSGAVERLRFAKPDEVVRRLKSVRYRGGTSLAALAGQRLNGADACLLFTDGLVTIDRREGFRPDCPLFALSSAPDADRAWLGALARASGGEAIDLASREPAEALTRLTRRVPRVLDVRTSAGAAIDYAVLDGGEYGWRIVGPMPEGGDIVVRLAGIEAAAAERVYSPFEVEAVEMAGAGALWAADRIGVRAASDDLDRAELIRFSRRYAVASPGISFVVLESASDYAQAEIEPPAGFPKDQRQIYDAMRAEAEGNAQRAKDERLATVLRQWDEHQAWWHRRFDPNAKPPREKPEQSRNGPPPPAPVMAPPPPAPEPVPPPPAEAMPPPPAEPTASGTASEGADVTVTGTRVRRPNLESATPITVISNQEVAADGAQQESSATRIALEPWSPDRPYLAALNAAAPAEIERVLAEQQAKHGALPAFWLDVAEWHFRNRRRDDALATLLSALELPTRNSQTLAIVADRLIRYGDLDRAIFLLERLVAAEPDRPQPRRSLALALAKRAETGGDERRRSDLARAISLLTEIVMTPWSRAYDGIEMISLMEVNRLIPIYRKLGGEAVALDPRLIALLDVDIRVVIEWNSEATDVDLWVDEPNGERAIYSNPRTLIGGRLSDDMTQGYGPEEYWLRRAPDGTFTVRAHVYAADRLNPNGASQVSARLIRDFGRPTQREEAIDIELLPDAQARERLIGRMTVKR